MNTKINQKLFEELIKAASKNRRGLLRLKNAIVTCEQFELASRIREIECAAFPETEEIKKAKAYAKELSLVFRMVGLDVKDSTCWLIGETLKSKAKKKEKFSIKDAVDLQIKKDEIFPID